jgi:hypothetical protein
LNKTTASIWARNIHEKKVLVLSNQDLTIKPELRGENYYINSLVSKIRNYGINIDVALFKEKKIIFGNHLMFDNLEDIIDDNYLVILHNVSPCFALKTKIVRKAKVAEIKYQVWSKVDNLTANLRSRCGTFLWQALVDEFVVSSFNSARYLERIGIFRKKITLLPPEYSCPLCNQLNNIKKKEKLNHMLPRVVNCVYIGSLNPKRFSLSKTVVALNRDLDRKYKLTIYTTSQTEDKSYDAGNVEVTIQQKILSASEKCEILRDSHIFIAPAKGTTMDPPISVIEAEWHGNLIMRL